MILYGRNPVREAIAAGRRPVERVWATAGAAKEFPGSQVVEAEEVERRAGTAAHQGVCAEVGEYLYTDPTSLIDRPDPLIVVLDELKDPQNLGAIARTAEVAGADGLVIGRHRSAEVTPAVAKASAGAVEHLPIARVRNIADFLADAKRAGHWIYGAAGDGEPYDSVDYIGGRVLVMGTEGTGLRKRVRDSCDVLVALPQSGKLDSLNVSAAAAVLIYALR